MYLCLNEDCSLKIGGLKDNGATTQREVLPEVQGYYKNTYKRIHYIYISFELLLRNWNYII